MERTQFVEDAKFFLSRYEDTGEESYLRQLILLLDAEFITLKAKKP